MVVINLVKKNELNIIIYNIIITAVSNNIILFARRMTNLKQCSDAVAEYIIII